MSILLAVSAPTSLSAQDGDDGGGGGGDAPSFTLNAMMKMQGGVFAPLFSDKFSPHKNRAYAKDAFGRLTTPCDPVATPNQPCYPVDHGQKPGSPSLGRGTLQIEAHWDVTNRVAAHAIVRGVRSLALPADQYAQVPRPPTDPDERASYAQEWVHDNYYTELDLRELYVDLTPADWLYFRIGRQQIAWGETGQFRLLDVVNPVDNTWHFGPLESFEDQRIPLWMWLTELTIPKLEASLELLWIPLIDRKRDTVSVPLSLAGAWGVPYSNQPTPYFVKYKDFRYPGNEARDMRGGARFKGVLGQQTSYSLVYMYTHQQLPIPVRVEYEEVPGGFSSTTVERAKLVFPRQHIAGFSLEYAFESPISTIARLEAAVEPNRTLPSRIDQNIVYVEPGVVRFTPKQKAAVSYAAVVQRPTMIRFLNPTQNFLLVGQFMHTYVPGLDVKGADSNLVEVPGYNAWQAQKHAYRVIFFATTNYLNGLITPRFTGAYLPSPYAKDSGFYSIDVGLRLGPHYRVNLTLTDFIGKDPYRDLGLYRDRDEVAASLTVLL